MYSSRSIMTRPYCFHFHFHYIYFQMVRYKFIDLFVFLVLNKQCSYLLDTNRLVSINFVTNMFSQMVLTLLKSSIMLLSSPGRGISQLFTNNIPVIVISHAGFSLLVCLFANVFVFIL